MSKDEGKKNCSSEQGAKTHSTRFLRAVHLLKNSYKVNGVSFYEHAHI